MARPEEGPARRMGLWRHALVYLFVFYPAWFFLVGVDLFAPVAVYIGLVFVVRFVRDRRR